MATAKCGTAELTYDEGCEYFCWCPKGGKQCVWSLVCPGSDGKDVGFSGVGLEVQPGDDDDNDGRPPRLDHISFDGSAEGFAARMLEHAGRRLHVPKDLVGRRIRIDLEGDFDDAIAAAGFGESNVVDEKRYGPGPARPIQGDEPSSIPEPGLVLVAAASVGQTGGLTMPPGQFATPGLAVTHVATGVYRLSFPGYAPDGRYLVTGMARVDLREAPRVIEHVSGGVAEVSGSVDESLGLYIRISALTGVVVDSAFEIQIYASVVAP